MQEIKKRFAATVITLLVAMPHIIKQDERGKNAKHLKLIRDLNYYNYILNFDELEIELESLKYFEDQIKDSCQIDEISFFKQQFG